MPIVYRKTAKGLAEIETRANRLAPRLRAALIVIDGKRDEAELARLILQQPRETLDWLREQGFIEAGTPAPPGPPAAPASTPATAAPAAPAAPTADLVTLRRDAVRQLFDLLGPDAEQLAMRMEQAGSVAALREHLPMAVRLIGAVRGRTAAESYARRFGLL